MATVMKWSGMALIVLCTTALGLSASQALERRVRELETALAALTGLEGELRYSLAPPDAAIARLEERESLAAAGYLPACSALCRRGTPFPEAWRRALERNQGALSPEDLLILSALSDTLGQCDLDGQLAQVAQAQRLLKLQLDSARQQSAARGKLYRTMGLLSGAFLVVLFL